MPNGTKLKNASNGSVTLAVRGQIVKAQGCSDAANNDYGSMYGIGAWNDKVYGFSHVNGAVVEIDNGNGQACLIQSYPDDKWSGAGVTTLAPVMVPPPK